MPQRKPNPYLKARPLADPYVTITAGDWEYRILKLYQHPDAAFANPYGRALCAVRSPMTFDSWEYGDTYLKDIPGCRRSLFTTDEGRPDFTVGAVLRHKKEAR